jgi:quercetin dioxygenase-like cupin family protein
MTRWGIAWLGAAMLVASCGGRTSKPRTETPSTNVAVSTAAVAISDPSGVDDTTASEEQIAAIEFSINQLDEGVQICWAAAAANDGYELAGHIKARVAIGAGAATAELVEDGTGNAQLTSCVVSLLQRFRWAPPLHGQTIELPFEFRAPRQQFVVDRRLISAHIPPRASAAMTPSISVLLDEQNAGSVDASLLLVSLPANTSTGRRVAARSETWLFLNDAALSDGKRQTVVRAGDAVILAAGTVRSIAAGATASNALLLVTPGGRESSSRAGALATPLASETLVPSQGAFRTLQPTLAGLGDAAISVVAKLEVAIGVSQHIAVSALFLYVTSGAGTLTVDGDGVAIAIDQFSVVQLPSNTRYQLQVTAPLQGFLFRLPAPPLAPKTSKSPSRK